MQAVQWVVKASKLLRINFLKHRTCIVYAMCPKRPCFVVRKIIFPTKLVSMNKIMVRLSLGNSKVTEKSPFVYEKVPIW